MKDESAHDAAQDIANCGRVLEGIRLGVEDLRQPATEEGETEAKDYTHDDYGEG